MRRTAVNRLRTGPSTRKQLEAGNWTVQLEHGLERWVHNHRRCQNSRATSLPEGVPHSVPHVVDPDEVEHSSQSILLFRHADGRAQAVRAKFEDTLESGIASSVQASPMYGAGTRR